MDEIEDILTILEDELGNVSGYQYLLLQDDIALGKVIIQDIKDYIERTRYITEGKL